MRGLRTCLFCDGRGYLLPSGTSCPFCSRRGCVDSPPRINLPRMKMRNPDDLPLDLLRDLYHGRITKDEAFKLADERKAGVE